MEFSRSSLNSFINHLATVSITLTANFLILIPNQVGLSQSSLSLKNSYSINYIPSGAMEPNLQHNDSILIDKKAYQSQLPKRGDIILFKANANLQREYQNSNITFAMRIIALPGEKVKLQNGKVYINNKPLNESKYLSQQQRTAIDVCPSGQQAPFLSRPVTIPPNSYLVLADNRDSSYDGRCWGVISKELIIGQAVRIVWPPSRQQELDPARKNRNLSAEELFINSGNLVLSNIKDLGDLTTVIKYFEQRLAAAQKKPDRQYQITPLMQLARAYNQLGESEKAVAYAQQLLPIAVASQNYEAQLAALVFLSKYYLELAQYDEVIKYNQQVLEITPKLENRNNQEKIAAAAFYSLGLAYFNQGDYNKAIDSAQKILEKAKNINDINQTVEALAFEIMGLAYFGMGNYEQAGNYSQRMLENVDSSNLQLQARALFIKGLFFLGKSNFADAEKSLLEAMTIQESLRNQLGDEDSNNIFKVSVLDQQIDNYIVLQKVLITQNKIETALEISERGRARAFVDLLAKRQDLSNSNSQNISLTNIQKIKQLAKAQNATLVEYSAVWDELYIWVVKPTGEVAFRSVDLAKINLANVAQGTLQSAARMPFSRGLADTAISDFVRNTRAAIEVKGNNPSEEPIVDKKVNSSSCIGKKCFQQMYSLLIEPIADLLPKNPESQIIFIPHQSLFLVPFAALIDQDGNYLIEKHTIRIAPSIQVLDLTQKQKLQQAVQPKVLLVGNPTMPTIPPLHPGETPQQLEPLPGAEQEVLAISKLLKAQVLLGNQATKAAVIQQMLEAKIIHLATHGLLDDFKGTGIPGVIALAPSPQDNGLLTADEIFNLKLNADLVVLSACETGRGRITGDGVIGLSRSFITAGSKSVVVSLWQVPDESTALLMQEFYRQLQKNSDKAQALRQAMLATSKQYSAPRDWAAFSLIGDAK
ncbi:TPR repeat-containing protein [Tolypothrix tenuis PCC 7101]|uniref:Signal peptidase I n=1 Tax=Tolypothrix tenuis PCC 7101 TaxID=231146 RepID=A0A1Z4N778_9CYAN|nr:signal peptidase I [Aulosira sp. FACHB-113]BAZ01568.1 TPR repeat-containing protein [Tolypothrix tenuis PCC 7101]BAZ74506.1 TPR repeat-containing protein [Aulosira laxa NIES-50]